MGASSNRRRITIIDKKFQIRFAIYMCLWVVALCFIYPFIVKSLFDYFFRLTAHDPLGPDLESLFRVRREVLTLLILTETAFLTMTFMMVIFVSHRIAGPLFKLRRALTDFGGGELRNPLKFRNKDYFHNLADDFNRMVAQVRERSRHDAEMVAVALSRVGEARDKGTDPVRAELDPALAILRKLHEEHVQQASAAYRTEGLEFSGKKEASEKSGSSGTPVISETKDAEKNLMNEKAGDDDGGTKTA